jgi:hypothetical protein
MTAWLLLRQEPAPRVSPAPEATPAPEAGMDSRVFALIFRRGRSASALTESGYAPGHAGSGAGGLTP